MIYLIAVLVIVAFIGGIAVYKHRAKLKAAAAAELKDDYALDTHGYF